MAESDPSKQSGEQLDPLTQASIKIAQLEAKIASLETAVSDSGKRLNDVLESNMKLFALAQQRPAADPAPAPEVKQEAEELDALVKAFTD